MRLLRLTPVLFLAAGAAHAGDMRDFCADRPGKATPPCILDAGHVQLEVGLADAAVERSAGQHEDVYAVGGAELRVGLTGRLELEAGWTPVIIDRQRGAGAVTGIGDAVLGLRRALTDPDAEGTAVAIQGFVTAPTATHGLGAGGWTGGVRLPVSLPLGKDNALGLTPEIDVVRNASGGGAHLAWQAAAGVSHAIGHATLGAELWGAVDDDPSGRFREISADFTAAYAVGKDAQLDAGVNLGLNRDTPGVELYAGIARRF